jgi:hypothetical protein
MKEQKLDARISIIPSYDDAITITIHDETAGIGFLEIVLSREQFINATMNHLGRTEVKSAVARGLEIVGKTMEQQPFTFEIPSWHDKDAAVKLAQKLCPAGWTPDLHFGSQDSFFHKDGKVFARTTVRRWV